MMHTCHCKAAPYPHAVGTAGCKGSSKRSLAEPRCGYCGCMDWGVAGRGANRGPYCLDCGGVEIYADAMCIDLVEYEGDER